LKERTIRFLKIAEKYNFCFKQSKCNFNMEEIPILEVVIGKAQDKSSQEIEDNKSTSTFPSKKGR